MGDIAAIFHWGPDVLLGLALDDLIYWHSLAVDRWNFLHGTKD